MDVNSVCEKVIYMVVIFSILDDLMGPERSGKITRFVPELIQNLQDKIKFLVC